MRSEQIVELGRRAIWDQDVDSLPAWKANGLRVARLIYKVVQDVLDGDLTLRAMSLVYTTLLSFIPLLAVSFSVLKGFGVGDQIEIYLDPLVAPLGEKGEEISQNIIGFVENIKVGTLGSVGLGMLLYTVISLVQKIESAFNYTWHTAQTRSFGQRFSDYLSVIMIGPLLMFSALGLTTAIMSNSFVQMIISIEPLGSVFHSLTLLVPYLLVIAAFTFVYTFVPNIRVKIGSAFVGALVAGILWQALGYIFASFVAGSGKYTAIYSGFAIVILFMFWLYISWLILLIGASIAFYHQHPEYLISASHHLRLSPRLKEKLALMVSYLIGQGYFRGQPAWTLDGLSTRLGLPADAVDGVVVAMCGQDLLTRTDSDPPGYLPARALERIRLIEVIEAVRSAEESTSLDLGRLRADQVVDQLYSGIDCALRDSLADRNLRDLVLEGTSSERN